MRACKRSCSAQLRRRTPIREPGSRTERLISRSASAIWAVAAETVLRLITVRVCAHEQKESGVSLPSRAGYSSQKNFQTEPGIPSKRIFKKNFFEKELPSSCSLPLSPSHNTQPTAQSTAAAAKGARAKATSARALSSPGGTTAHTSESAGTAAASEEPHNSSPRRARVSTSSREPPSHADTWQI